MINVILKMCDKTGKDRPEWFSKQGCFRSLLLACDQRASLYIVCDAMQDTELAEFVQAEAVGTHIEIEHVDYADSWGAFTRALEVACSLPNDAPAYLVEDDYLHLPNAIAMLSEGLESDRFHYVTGYDHPDKYLNQSPNPFVKEGAEHSRVYCTGSFHWKTTNSTTGTFAARVCTLKEDWSVWRKAAIVGTRSDFWAFNELRHRIVASSLPAVSTHCERSWLAPRVHWERVAAAFAEVA